MPNPPLTSLTSDLLTPEMMALSLLLVALVGAVVTAGRFLAAQTRGKASALVPVPVRVRRAGRRRIE